MRRFAPVVVVGVVFAGGLGVGVGIGAALSGSPSGDAFVTGTPTQTQLLYVQTASGYLTSSPFPLAGGTAVVDVPAHTHAVVTVEPENEFLTKPGSVPSGSCNDDNTAATVGIAVDGTVSGPTFPGSTIGTFPWTLWTSPLLSPGRHTIALTLSCPTVDPADPYTVSWGGTLRVDRLKVG